MYRLKGIQPPADAISSRMRAISRSDCASASGPGAGKLSDS
jgi:hypothetical protein